MRRGGEKEVKEKTRDLGQKRWRDSLSQAEPWGGGVGHRRTWERWEQIWRHPFSNRYSFSIFLKSSKKASMKGEKYRKGSLLPIGCRNVGTLSF